MTHLCASSDDPFVNTVLRVDTIANLRLVAVPTDRQVFVTEGTSVAGDGGSRFYYWDSASVTADNGGSVVQITGQTTGRFLDLSLAVVVALTSSTAAAILAKPESIIVACSDETTALSAGTGKVTFRMPYAFTVTAVRASLTTAQASGNIFTVDINDSGTTILSTKLTIDNTELTSVTAVTPPVISDSALANDAQITVDIDQIGNGSATGLKITLIGHQ